MKISNKILEEQHKFKQFLIKSGFHLTNGRQTVFEEVMNAHGHFAAEELVKQCQKNRRKVSRATIYRSLKELLTAGIIRGTAFGEKHQHFEHIYDERPHHHARCIECYTIIEIDDLGEDVAYHSILNKIGFKILGHEMHFYGLCKNCFNKKSESLNFK